MYQGAAAAACLSRAAHLAACLGPATAMWRQPRSLLALVTTLRVRAAGVVALAVPAASMTAAQWVCLHDPHACMAAACRPSSVTHVPVTVLLPALLCLRLVLPLPLAAIVVLAVSFAVASISHGSKTAID